MKEAAVSNAELSVLGFRMRAATEAAARAAYDWIGRGDKVEGDRAAMAAMRAELAGLPVRGTIVVGESGSGGLGDDGTALLAGDVIGGRGAGGPGAGSAPFDPGAGSAPFDIAVDPVEGTSYLARGMTNALAVLAMAPQGSLFRPGPCFYMEKFVGPPVVRGKIDPGMSVADKLAVVARETGKPLTDLTVFVLEKPRHRDLIQDIYAAGARVALYPAGDIAGALMAAIPDSGIDCLMGTGGTPEGIITACAIRSLGGVFYGRMNPQLNGERLAVRDAGIDTNRWYAAEDLARSDQVVFCATGITTGLLLQGVERQGRSVRTETLLLCGEGQGRQVISNWQPVAAGAARP